MLTKVLIGVKGLPARHRILLIALPVVVVLGLLGACAGLTKSNAGARGRDDTVVVVLPKSASQDANSRRLADELTREPGFTWKVTDTASGTAPSHPIAIVTLPAPRDPIADTAALSPMKIDPVRFLPDDRRYIQLMQAAYEGAVRASLGQILDAVSRARIKLNAASFTAAAMDGELKDADATVDSSTAGFNNLIATSEPILGSTRYLLNSYRPSINALSGLADSLMALAARPVEATLGDIRAGLDMNQRAVNATSPFMPQMQDVARIASTDLSASPSADVRSIGDQLNVILRLAAADGQLSTGGRILSPEELSQMFGVPVSDSTTLSDFISISASRVRGIVGTFSEASRRLDQMAAMVADAKTTFLTSKAQINQRLDTFRDVVGKLNAMLHTATELLPTPASNEAADNLVALDQRQIDKFSAAERSAYVVLIGALLCASFIVSSGHATTIATRAAFWLTASALLAAVVAATMATFGGFTYTFAAGLAVSVVSVGISLIILRIAPRWGLAFGLAVVIGDIALATRTYSSSAGFISTQVLPSSFIGRILASGLELNTYGGAEVLAALVVAVGAAGCLVGRRSTQPPPSSSLSPGAGGQLRAELSS
jgi:hypothetical protein